MHGELYVEGSIKQLKQLMQKYLIIKPACMFDSTINLEAKVMYSSHGQYSEGHTRLMNIDLSQKKKYNAGFEKDHQIKYRFLHFTDQGGLEQINQESDGEAEGQNDVSLTIKGYPGSGFETCSTVTMQLPHGSQYQKSYLPEMKNE